MDPRIRRVLNRNPDLEARYKRLSAGARANVNTTLQGGTARGLTKAIRLADEVRREQVRERSSQRRAATRSEKDWGYVKARSYQPLKYRAWLKDDFGNVRGTMDFRKAPGDIIGDHEYRENRYKDGGLVVVAVTVK